LLALKQGSDTVYEYAKKFNALCQYGGHHVDNDAKKIERFRDGLHGDLYERLNLYEPNSYQDLVNKAISQEDAMSKALKARKRQARFTATGGSGKNTLCQERYSGSSPVIFNWTLEGEPISE
jgi:hypothetical protein